MAEKTPGQIAYEASGLYLATEYKETHDQWAHQLPGTKGHWEAAANAVIEMCAKICNQMAHERRELLFKTPEGSASSIGLDMAQAALDNAGAALRDLKDTSHG